MMNSFIYKIMEIYEIGYWSHEESPKILFTCDKDYTQEQFIDLVSDIIADLGLIDIEKYGIFNSKFEDILEPLYFKLQEFGFKEIKSTVKVNPFGCAILTNEHWKYDIPETDDLNILREKIRERLNYGL